MLGYAHMWCSILPRIRARIAARAADRAFREAERILRALGPVEEMKNLSVPSFGPGASHRNARDATVIALCPRPCGTVYRTWRDSCPACGRDRLAALHVGKRWYEHRTRPTSTGRARW